MPLNSRDAIGTQISNGGNNGLLKKRKKSAATTQRRWTGKATPEMIKRSVQLYGGMLPGAGRPSVLPHQRNTEGGFGPLPGDTGEEQFAILGYRPDEATPAPQSRESMKPVGLVDFLGVTQSPNITQGDVDRLRARRMKVNPNLLSPADSAHVDRHGGIPALQQTNANLDGILRDMRNRNASLTNGGNSGSAMERTMAAVNADAPPTMWEQSDNRAMNRLKEAGWSDEMASRFRDVGRPGFSMTGARVPGRNGGYYWGNALRREQGPPEARLSGLYARRAAERAAMEEGIPRADDTESGEITREILARQGVNARPGQGAALYVNSRMIPGSADAGEIAKVEGARARREAIKSIETERRRQLITARARRKAAAREARLQQRANNAVMNTEGMLMQAALAGNPQAVPMLGLLAKNRDAAAQRQVDIWRAQQGFDLQDRNLDLMEARNKANAGIQGQLAGAQAGLLGAQANKANAEAGILEDGVDEEPVLTPEGIRASAENATKPIDLQTDLPQVMDIISQLEGLDPEEQIKHMRGQNWSPAYLDRIIKELEKEGPERPSFWKWGANKFADYGQKIQEWNQAIGKLKKARSYFDQK